MTKIKKNGEFRKILLIIAVVAAFLLAAKIGYLTYFKLCENCGNTPSKDVKVNNVSSIGKHYGALSIVYSSENGSLPPPYHKEKIVNITTDTIGEIKGEYMVQGYKKDEIMEKRGLSVTYEQLEKLIAAAAKINPNSDESSTDGCTGGTSKSIKISQYDRTILETSNYSCALKVSNVSLEKFFLEAGSIIPVGE